MRKYILAAAALLLIATYARPGYAQVQLNINDLAPHEAYDNILVKPIGHDSLSSSFVVWIKQTVPLHLHKHHTEHVYVLEGTGTMVLGNDTITVKPGDVLLIPENTPHAVTVTSASPMKVLSVQAPYFDGTDRHPVPAKKN